MQTGEAYIHPDLQVDNDMIYSKKSERKNSQETQEMIRLRLSSEHVRSHSTRVRTILLRNTLMDLLYN